MLRRLLLLGALLLAVAPAAAAEGEAPPPDVVLVTLDTVRADYVGPYGGPAATPTLDALAAAGLRYATAVAPSPLTLPTHCSLMTGADPPAHGVRDNGLARLPEDLPVVAERFAAAGYRTAAFVASRVLDRRFGLERGFDHYDDEMAAERLGEYGYPERPAAEVTDAALAWVAGAGERPLFLWVHYYDAHAPYAPPAPFGGAGGDERERYAGEIAYVDRELGRLLAGLPERPRRVAVVGDHGEALGDHGERTHGLFLYRASLEVPLLLQGPGLPAGRVVEGAVGIRRLAPTLLALSGLERSGFGEPLPTAAGAGARPPVYSETLLPATAYGWSALAALTEDAWKLIAAPRPELYDLAADPAEERNLIGERRDVARRLKVLLDEHLEARERRQPAAPPGGAETAAMLRSLGYLSGASGGEGVIGGVDPKDGLVLLERWHEARQLAASDPKAAAAALERLVAESPGNVPFLASLGRTRLSAGDAARAAAAYERALAINPRLDFLHLGLAEAERARGRAEAADRAYAAALALNPRSAAAWLGRAELALRGGEAEREAELLAAAAEAGTASVTVLARLAQIAAAAGDHERADRHLAAAARLAPERPEPWLVRGGIEEQRGNLEAAVAAYRHAVELDGGQLVALFRAGSLLLKSGRRDEGRALLEQVVERAPGSGLAREARRLLGS